MFSLNIKKSLHHLLKSRKIQKATGAKNDQIKQQLNIHTRGEKMMEMSQNATEKQGKSQNMNR